MRAAVGDSNVLSIRPAVLPDERRLVALVRSTWSWGVAPVPLWPADRDIFGDTRPDDVMVSERGTTIVGYVRLRPPTQHESNK